MDGVGVTAGAITDTAIAADTVTADAATLQERADMLAALLVDT
jgi:hypothetical protein